MNEFLVIIAAAIALLAAVYAQYGIPRHTAGRVKIALTRSVLAVIGLLLGSFLAARYPDDGLRALLAFLIGFGAVHVPAAIILLLKRARGMGKS